MWLNKSCISAEYYSKHTGPPTIPSPSALVTVIYRRDFICIQHRLSIILAQKFPIMILIFCYARSK